MSNEIYYNIRIKNRAGMEIDVDVAGNNKYEAVGRAVSLYPHLFLKVIKIEELKVNEEATEQEMLEAESRMLFM